MYELTLALRVVAPKYKIYDFVDASFSNYRRKEHKNNDGI